MLSKISGSCTRAAWLLQYHWVRPDWMGLAWSNQTRTCKTGSVDWQIWEADWLRTECTYWVAFPLTLCPFLDISDRSPVFTDLLEVNDIERCFWYLSLKFLSEYFFIVLLDSFFCFVGTVFSFCFCYFHLLFCFVFVFRADPPEPQQERTGRHSTAVLTPPWYPDPTDPRQGRAV